MSTDVPLMSCILCNARIVQDPPTCYFAQIFHVRMHVRSIRYVVFHYNYMCIIPSYCVLYPIVYYTLLLRTRRRKTQDLTPKPPDGSLSAVLVMFSVDSAGIGQLAQLLRGIT